MKTCTANCRWRWAKARLNKLAKRAAAGGGQKAGSEGFRLKKAAQQHVLFIASAGFLCHQEAMPTAARKASPATPSTALCGISRTLSDTVDGLHFTAPVTHTYNPLDYAWAPHEQYLTRYGQGRKRVIFLGMNPGPFGMVQTGVPFGEVKAVKEWLQINAPVQQPAKLSPFRPITGMQTTRSEVSGARLWALFAEKYKTPATFFADHFVANYCPLAFLDEGRNVTPDKLKKEEVAPLISACDTHLRHMAELLQPTHLIGIGKYARKQAERALKGYDITFGDILHPSPASPAANKGWAPLAARQLEELGLW